MTKKKGKAHGLRARLASRALPEITWTMLIADATAAEEQLHSIMREYRQVTLASKPDAPEVAEVKARLDAAKAAVEECYEPILLRAMLPDAYEALRSAHPPTPEQAEKGEVWNEASFRGPLLEATAVSDLTAEEWETHLTKSMSSGERTSLVNAAIAVNEAARISDPVVLPKGSLPMRF